MPTTSRAVGGTVPVALSTRPVQAGDALDCLVALRTHVGADRVFMFESLAGPDVDRRASMVGVTGLLEVSVHRGRVTLTGVPALIEAVTTALTATELVTTDADGLHLVDSAALWELPRVMDAVFAVDRDPERFGFGVLVFYGYDAVGYIETLPRTIPDGPDPAPDAVFSLVQALVRIDLTTGEADLSVASSDAWPALDVEDLVRIVDGSAGAAGTEPGPVPVPAPVSVVDDTTHEDYLDRAATCLEHIRVGDIYQVQLGHELTVTTPVDDIAVYRRLRWRNPSPYMSLMPIAGRVVVGASPELFLRLEGDVATMRPIAGTARRSDDAERDAIATRELLANPKERAEHIMLIDLCRNDMGRIAQVMSVDVTEMMIIEAYSHLFHIVSNVDARVRPDCDVYDVIKACFPAGTMTGAPKVRAMEIIEGLEESRRGLYAGSFGLIGFGGWSILGLAIRMTVRHGDTYSLRASAGIVSDSDPEAEWNETLTKLGATYWAVTGEELR